MRRLIQTLILSCLLNLYAHSQSLSNDSLSRQDRLPDSTQKIIISDIIILGNKKTKDYIIVREMLFKKGDSINPAELFTLLEESRKLIYNTTLFTSVELIPSLVTDGRTTITVKVKERWYIYPIPQFQLVDRNLNEWINTYNASLDRVIYGAKFIHYNFSGRRDQLRIFALNGYSRNFSIAYTSPYSNSALTEGFTLGSAFQQNREVAFRTTLNNKLLQYRNGNFVRTNIVAFAGYIIRRGYYRSHQLNLVYTYSSVTDSLLIYNPSFFNSEKTKQHIPELSYQFHYLKVDNVAYPLQGRSMLLGVTKKGFGFDGGINALTLDAIFNAYKGLGKNWYLSFNSASKVKLPFHLAYINRRALGFLDFYLRGLEYYVIDGVASSVFKTTLRKKVADFKIKTPFHFKVIPEIPFKVFVKTYGDLGYSYDKGPNISELNNRLLYTGGLGIDILTVYDLNLRFEYSFNQLNQNGLFLHTKGGF